MSLISEALSRWLPTYRQAPSSQLAERESLGAIKEAPLGTIHKGSSVGPLIAYQTLGEPVWAPRDYTAFAHEGFMQNAIVYRSVRMIAEAAATIPLLLYEGANEIEHHPLIDLIRRPSLDHTGTDFLEAWYGFLLVSGNAYVEAVALDGEIRELHILRPDRMKVIPGVDGWPEGYEYTVCGRSVRFIDDVVEGVRPILHVRLFHPVNDHYGMSPIEAAATAIDIHNTASGWNKALLDNSARPSGALVYSNDPFDPGGPTNRGITLGVYASFKNETVDDASRARLIAELKRISDTTVKTIYRQRYFDQAACPVFTAPLALMHFDTAVNHGVGTAIRMLQGIAGATADSEIGPETLAAIGARSLSDLLDAYAEARRTRYRALPHFWRFGRGWLKRVDATLALARTWAAADATNRGLLEPQQIAKGESKMSNTTNGQTQATGDDGKWWAHSKTMWGTLITAAATVIPTIGPALGIVLPADIIQTFGDQAITAVQAVAGLFGTVLAIYGRLKADTPIALRKS